MFPDVALKQLLESRPYVVGLVGNRIYPGVLPQTMIPTTGYVAIAYRLVPGGTEYETLDVGTAPGEIQESAGLVMERFRFFSVAQGPSNYGLARKLDNFVRLALQGFHGTVINDNSPIDSVEIQNISAFASHYAYDDKTQTHQFIRDFRVWTAEQQPVVE